MVFCIDFHYFFETFELQIVDSIVITEMRTAAASAVATKVRRETDLNLICTYLYVFKSLMNLNLNYGCTNVKPVVAKQFYFTQCDLF